jgi:hypothetical protein
VTVLGAHDADAAEAAVDALLALPGPPTGVFAALIARGSGEVKP